VLVAPRRLGGRGALGVLLPLAIAGGIVVLSAWHGPIVLTLSEGHGVDAGDLPAVAFVIAGLAVARSRARVRTGGSRRLLAAAAVTLGVVLLFGAVRLYGDGGALAPGGGATLDGAVEQAVHTRAIPVGRWTNLALTYNGATLRLYENAVEVAQRTGTGRIASPALPLRVGGNRPYGEHFEGLIDDVRVYDRALSPAELHRDMGGPARRAPGLVAGYPFDSGSGSLAPDASGRGNEGRIHGARWVPGRHGDALRFDGVRSVVTVPSSPSLDLADAMTLSGWVRPSRFQRGWRAVVQREPDAYFLAASSEPQTRYGLVDTVRIALIVLAAAWLATLIATHQGPHSPRRRRTWWAPLALFALGSVADVALTPDATVIGPLFVAAWLAATSETRVERAVFVFAALACICVSGAAIAGAIGPVISRNEGSVVRTVALAALIMAGGALALWRSRPTAEGPGRRKLALRPSVS
jgi:hypothetical protein